MNNTKYKLHCVHTQGPIQDSGGAPSFQGAPTYDFAKFSKKLHEIEKILSRNWAGAPP